MTVSVAMAVYNGEKYIAKQIESILLQLRENDELVISINTSTDRTEEIIEDYKKSDSRIKIIRCMERGVLNNFESAIRNCSNNIIFLSDQDDVWVQGKLIEQLKYFVDPTVLGTCHGCSYIDSDDKMLIEHPTLRKKREVRPFEIIKQNPVQGSTLAFRKELRDQFLPFPEKIPMHDSWIGLFLCRNGKLIYIDESLLLYRQHEGTVTVRQHKKAIPMLRDRVNLVLLFQKRIRMVKETEK